MNRRGFLKTLLGGAMAAALPACRRPEPEFFSTPGYVAYDLTEPGTDKSGVIFMESTPEGRNIWADQHWNNWKWKQDNVVHVSNELSEEFAYAIKPKLRFKNNPKFLQAEMNKLASDRINIIKTANIGPTTINNAMLSGRQFGKTEMTQEAVERLMKDLYAAKV